MNYCQCSASSERQVYDHEAAIAYETRIRRELVVSSCSSDGFLLITFDYFLPNFFTYDRLIFP